VQSNCFICRLDERKRRKEFILERNLLFPNPLEKDLTNEDREVYHRYKVFMRFLSKEEHEALVRSVIEERKIRRRIQELQVLCLFIRFRSYRINYVNVF
jgi:transcriptional adapter 2-alpha